MTPALHVSSLLWSFIKQNCSSNVGLTTITTSYHIIFHFYPALHFAAWNIKRPLACEMDSLSCQLQDKQSKAAFAFPFFSSKAEAMRFMNSLAL